MSRNGSEVAAPALAIAFHSGFGHTAVLAEAVAAGTREAGGHVSVIAVDRMTDTDWDILDGADGIVFGCATYMGNVSAGFQAFAEQTGRRCLNGSWRDKVDDLNRLGFWLGAGAQTDVDANSDQVHPSDMQTCRHLGNRVAVVTRQLNLGRSATSAASSPAGASAPTR
jgi:multimeric flavodoxin WrbA